MNNNNSITSIVSYVNGQLSGIPVLGNNDVPTQFYSIKQFSSANYSFDFLNLFNHCSRVAERNANIQDNSLFVLKSRSLDASHWNDQSFMETLNKITLFQENIAEYKNAVRRLVEDGNFTRQFLDLSTASENITACLLKTIYHTEGIHGIGILNDNLSNIIHGGNFNPDCLKIYNVIIYSAPFMLIDAANGAAFSQLAFFHSPYELISASMQNYLSTFQFEELTFLMKMQLKLERSLPDMQACRELYEALMWAYRRGRILGIISVVTVPTIGLLRYVPLMRSENAAGLVIQHIPQNRVDSARDSTDILINLLVDIIINS